MAEEGQFRLEHEPYYRPLHGEVELFEAAWRNRVPVLLKGAHGPAACRYCAF